MVSTNYRVLFWANRKLSVVILMFEEGRATVVLVCESCCNPRIYGREKGVKERSCFFAVHGGGKTSKCSGEKLLVAFLWGNLLQANWTLSLWYEEATQGVVRVEEWYELELLSFIFFSAHFVRSDPAVNLLSTQLPFFHHWSNWNRFCTDGTAFSDSGTFHCDDYIRMKESSYGAEIWRLENKVAKVQVFHWC